MTHDETRNNAAVAILSAIISHHGVGDDDPENDARIAVEYVDALFTVLGEEKHSDITAQLNEDSAAVFRAIKTLQDNDTPATSYQKISDESGLYYTKANALVKSLMQKGIVKNVDGCFIVA